jgi:HSP20 family protein
MKTLTPFNPLDELRTMEAMFDRMFAAPMRNPQSAGALAIDVTEAENKIFVRAAVPGVDPNELEISLDNNVLTLRGESKRETTREDEKVYRREVSYGAFARSLRLPENIDAEGIEATFKNGIVTITIPRRVEEKPEPKRITVRSEA